MQELTVLNQFENQVKKYSKSIALVFDNQEITYKTLNEKSNQLARYIQKIYNLEQKKKQLSQRCLIGIYSERSIDMIIGIISILKTGCAYIPLDLKLPEERIKFILKDSAIEFVLTQSSLQTQLYRVASSIHQVAIDQAPYYLEQTNKVTQSILGQHLFSILYTSGTTGQSKGVMLCHNNVLQLFKQIEQNNFFCHTSVWTMFHSYAFDFSIWEMWGALLYGSKLVIPSEYETKSIGAFYDLCEKYRVSILSQTPLVFYKFIQEALYRPRTLQDLKYIFIAGEKPSASKLKPWLEKYKIDKPELFNCYGITETTVMLTFKRLNNLDLCSESNIGNPILNTKFYILDEHLNPVPQGVSGELYVSGPGVALGYFNQPVLTTKRFIDNPFVSKDACNKYDDKIYKTGDLVRYLPDGTLEFLGRNDFQIKVLGFRVEIGEIELALNSHSKINQSVVLLKNEYEMEYLVGFYKADFMLDPEEIKQYLRKKLPEYMIPKKYIHVFEFPINSNGKLDHAALFSHELQGSFSLCVNNELLSVKVDALIDNVSEEKISRTEIESCATIIANKLSDFNQINTVLIQELSSTLSLSILLAAWILGKRVAIISEKINGSQLQNIRELLGNHLFIYYSKEHENINIEVNREQYEFIEWIHTNKTNFSTNNRYNWTENEVAIILFTSGSTGIPKGVCHSLPSLIRSVRLFESHFNIKISDTLACFAEIHTMSGFRSLLFALILKTTVFFISEHWPAIINKLQRIKPTIVICGPALLEFFIKFERATSSFPLRNARILCTGSYLDKKIVSEIYSRWGVPVLNYYGLIETAGIVFADNDLTFDDYLPPACAGTTYCLLPFDEQNNIFYLGIRSPNLFLGYLNEMINKPDTFNTGDLVSSHPENKLKMLGRASGAIKGKSTNWVYPSLLEKWLKNKNEVIDAVVTLANQSKHSLSAYIQTNEEITSLINQYLPMIALELGSDYCSISWNSSKIERSVLGKIEGIIMQEKEYV